MAKKNEICSLCGRNLTDGDNPDSACGRCNDESIDRLLAPFDVMEQKNRVGDKAGLDRSRRHWWNHDRDPGWIRLRAAALKRWPTFEAECDDQRIAIRLRKWLETNALTEPALQRPLVPAEVVMDLLRGESVGLLTEVAEPTAETQQDPEYEVQGSGQFVAGPADNILSPHQVEPKPLPTETGGHPPLQTELMALFAELSPDGEVTMKLARILSDESKGTNERMIEASEFNAFLYEKKSPWWAKVLRVSSQAIRNTDYWKRIRRDVLQRSKEFQQRSYEAD